MDADFSVELGADDPTLAVPWTSPDNAVRYVDLSAHPDEIEHLPEVKQFPELAPVLRMLNAEDSPLRTAKCDAWFDTLMDIDDEPYGAAIKCASYIDVFFPERCPLSEFAKHESSVRSIVQRLRSLPEEHVRVELAIRRCFHIDGASMPEGLYWTIYVFGYGDIPADARSAWSLGLAQVVKVLLNS